MNIGRFVRIHNYGGVELKEPIIIYRDNNGVDHTGQMLKESGDKFDSEWEQLGSQDFENLQLGIFLVPLPFNLAVIIMKICVRKLDE